MFQRVRASFLVEIVNYSIHRKNQGRAEATIINEVRTLKLLAKQANILDPESVKEAIANANVANATKSKRVKTYSAFLKWKKIEWTPPFYKPVEHIPFIPTENELDILIAASGKRLSTTLQMLKETGMRISEAHMIKWTDINFEAKTISITPAKGSLPRILPLSNKVLDMLNNLPKNRETILPTSQSSFRSGFNKQRIRTSLKLQNNRLMKISFHTFRHFKGTIEYHKTKDIMHVKYILGHRDIKTTLIYINIEQATFLNQTNDWTSKVSHTIEEETTLINTGFELVRSINETTAIYKKRK